MKRTIDLKTKKGKIELGKLFLIVTEVNKLKYSPTAGKATNLLSEVKYGIEGVSLMEVAKKLEIRVV